MVSRIFSARRAISAAAVFVSAAFLQTGAFAAACSTLNPGSVGYAGPTTVAGSPGGVNTAGLRLDGADSSACVALFNGNPSTADITAIATEMGWGTLFSSGIKSDAGALAGRQTVYENVTWTIGSLASPGSNGAWTLSYTANPDVSGTIDITGVVKAGNYYATFFFNDVAFATDGSKTGQFNVQFCTGGQTAPFTCNNPSGLSHLELVFSNFQDGEVPPNRVPEPAPIALMGLALAGLALVRRRATRNRAM